MLLRGPVTRLPLTLVPCSLHLHCFPPQKKSGKKALLNKSGEKRPVTRRGFRTTSMSDNKITFFFVCFVFFALEFILYTAFKPGYVGSFFFYVPKQKHELHRALFHDLDLFLFHVLFCRKKLLMCWKNKDDVDLLLFHVHALWFLVTHAALFFFKSFIILCLSVILFIYHL